MPLPGCGDSGGWAPGRSDGEPPCLPGESVTGCGHCEAALTNKSIKNIDQLEETLTNERLEYKKFTNDRILKTKF